MSCSVSPMALRVMALGLKTTEAGTFSVGLVLPQAYPAVDAANPAITMRLMDFNLIITPKGYMNGEP